MDGRPNLFQITNRDSKAPLSRGHFLPPFSNPTSLQDMNVAVFLRTARLLTFAGGFAPHRFLATAAAACFSFTATVWVVNGIHCGTAHGRADAEPARTAGFAEIDEMMFVI